MNSNLNNILPHDRDDDSLPSNLDPIDNLLDVLLDSKSSELEICPVQDETDIREDESNSESKMPLDDNLIESEKFTRQSPTSSSFDLDLDIDQDSSQYPDIEVEIEEQKQDITLEEAVEYQAFLRQKTVLGSEIKEPEKLPIDPSQTGSIEQYVEILEIDPESASKEDLVDAVNTLIPLIVELLKYKIHDSQVAIVDTVTPILEQIIEQRSVEEPHKMAAAIAKILPSAITEEIHLSPEEIAKAIAPELALSIKEQIRLDENAISEALGSEMGKAIKTQIEVEKDAMVDALYPVIGDTISKYMVEVVQEINSKVENTLSPEGFKRKIQAKIKGVSEAELILQESIGCHVQAIFLIDKDSGLVIQEIQKQNSGEQGLDSDMLAGMLTAIRSFANDCIVSGSELDSIDYGNWQIHLEVAGYCYLAVILKGEPNKNFIARVRRTFGEIILDHGNEIEQFDGNLETVPTPIQLELKKLIQSEDNPEQKSSSSPTTLLWLLAFILASILIPWGIVSYRSRNAQNIQQLTVIQLDAAPELSVYRLEPSVKKGKLIVKGRVPSEYLRDRAATISQKIAEEHNLQFNNEIIAVDVPINPSLLTGEITRLTELFNQQPKIAINTNYQSRTLSIQGFILDRDRQESILRAFSRIPGIDRTIANVANQLPTIKERIYFESADDKVNIEDNASKIKFVTEFLDRYPKLNLKLLAISDGIGSRQINQKLGIQRCSSLKDALIAKGVDSSRLITDCEPYRAFTQQNEKRSIQLTRYVEFEPFIPAK